LETVEHCRRPAGDDPTNPRVKKVAFPGCQAI
jgi:hypothetical protein